MKENVYFNVKEVSNIFGWHPETVRRKIRQGEIIGFSFGRSLIVTKDNITPILKKFIQKGGIPKVKELPDSKKLIISSIINTEKSPDSNILNICLISSNKYNTTIQKNVIYNSFEMFDLLKEIDYNMSSNKNDLKIKISKLIKKIDGDYKFL